MVLIDAVIFVWPAAFAIMLIASAILLLRTRRLHFLVQAIGFAALVSSQALQFAVYHAHAPQYDSGGGELLTGIQGNLAVLALWLSIFGLAAAAIGYALQCVATRERKRT